VDQSEAIRKARQLAQNSYAAQSNDILRERQHDLAKMRNQLAARGVAMSGEIVAETARITGERIRALTQARIDAILEGYELHGVVIDDQMAIELCDDLMHEINNMVHSAKKHVFPGVPTSAAALYPQLLDQNVGLSAAWVKTQIDRRRLMPKKNEVSTAINVYHVQGSNNRWLTNSQDYSVNVVTQSSEQIFSNLRQQIEAQVPDGDEKQDILDKFTALQQAENTSSFKQRYTDFIAAAANHMALVAPFIPALTEMLHKVL
jgi:hypothetical protein